jgi:hypothetical protein
VARDAPPGKTVGRGGGSKWVVHTPRCHGQLGIPWAGQGLVPGFVKPKIKSHEWSDFKKILNFVLVNQFLFEINKYIYY